MAGLGVLCWCAMGIVIVGGFEETSGYPIHMSMLVNVKGLFKNRQLTWVQHKYYELKFIFENFCTPLVKNGNHCLCK